MKSKFGARLRQERMRVGMSGRQLATLVGISDVYLSQVERGKMPPPADDKIAKIALALQQPADRWFALAGRLPPDVVDALSTDQEFRWQAVRHLDWDALKRKAQSPKYLEVLAEVFDTPPTQWDAQLLDLRTFSYPNRRRAVGRKQLVEKT